MHLSINKMLSFLFHHFWFPKKRFDNNYILNQVVSRNYTPKVQLFNIFCHALTPEQPYLSTNNMKTHL